MYLFESDKLTTRSSPQDWSALSANVQWAIIHDLANDHEDGISAAANLLGLNLDDVINFVNLYVREKMLWENGTYQDEPVYTARALFQLDGAQREAEQPTPEAEADQIMHEFDPDRQHLGVEATQTVTGAEANPPLLEGVRDVRHEPEVEPFSTTNPPSEAREETGQLGVEKSTGLPDVLMDDDLFDPAAWPPPVELVTDSFSREDIGSGRSFLEFVGLQDYADRFGQWFGTGTTFRDIPGIFDENNEFIFSTEDTEKALYSGNEFNWQGLVPQFEKGSAQREWLMEALPQDPAQDKEPVYPPLKQFHALAERVNARPISLHDKNERFLDYLPGGSYGELRYGEPDGSAALANIFANDKSDLKGAESVTNKEADGRAGNNVGRQNNSKSHGTSENVLQGIVGNFGDDGGRSFNTSSAMQPYPEMPRFDNAIARRFHEMRPMDIDEGYNVRKSVPPSYPPPFPQLPPFLQRHGDFVHQAGKAVPNLASHGHMVPKERQFSKDISSHVASNDQASQAWTRYSSSAAPNPMSSQSIETSLKLGARTMKEQDIGDARTTIESDPGEAVNKAASSEAQGAAEAGQFSENGIEVATFPKCYTCFKVRARCDGGRPCSSCLNRNRTCKPVTKAVLDEEPDRAERVIKDKAKTDSMAAQAVTPSMVPPTTLTTSAAVPAPAISHTATFGVKRNQSAMTVGALTDEDDSDLDNLPPEKDDPTDGDYGLAPKKKKQKKVNTPVGKKQNPSQAMAGVSATPTPKKKRGPYRKKADTSTPKSNESVVCATSTPTLQSGGSASDGKVVAATSAQKKSAKAPAAVEDRVSGSPMNAVEHSLLGAGVGRSLNDAAGAVRHAGGELGMTNARPVPVGKCDETPKLAQTHSILDPSLFSSNPSSGAGNSRYLDASFAPVATHTSTGRFMPGTPMAQVSRPVAGLSDTGFRASPSQGARSMPFAPSRFVPPSPRMSTAENDQLRDAEFPKTASSLRAPIAPQMFPVTADRMPLVPQIARPSLSGSPGTTEISPTSQSSYSGTTVFMDFSDIPFSPYQEPNSHRNVTVPGRLRQSSSDYPSTSGFSPTFSAGMVPMDSPTASQRRSSVPSYNLGAPGPGTSMVSPMMGADSGFTMAPGSMSPYAMHQQQRPIPRPISRMQQDPGYANPQQTMHLFRPSGEFYEPQSEEVRPGSRGVSVSPAGQQHNTDISRPAKRQVGSPLVPGQQPARKRPRVSASPLAPPREARSWKELARNQWASETQENQPETDSFSSKPAFGGDGSFEVSFSQFTRIQEQIDPELQQTAIATARKMNKSSAGTSEGR